MKIQILGTGCPRCKRLAENAEAAALAAGKDVSIEKVTNIKDIMAFGVITTPALVIDGEVKAAGKVPGVDEIEAMLG